MKLISYVFIIFAVVLGLACSHMFKNNDRTVANVDIPKMSFPSLANQIKNINPDKPTICSITLNSDDERNIFNHYMNNDFNFIELVTNPYVHGEGWFYKACDSGVTCDILLVSGHYASTFYSKDSNAILSSKTLERNSCAGPGQKLRCGGILQNPKEVYLFGCNTTAGKEADSRTLEEYIEVLLEEGIERERAATIAAFRYSEFGRNAYEVMQSVFHSAKIYGYTSKAPLGRQIKPALLQYMEGFPNGYKTDHFNEVTKTSKNTAWDRLMRKNHWSVRTVPGDASIESPQCKLFGDQPLIEKMKWIEKSLSNQEKALYAIPEIDDFYRTYLRKNYGENLERLPANAKRIQKNIQNNPFLKQRLIENIGDKPKKNFMSYQGKAFIYLDSVGLMSNKEVVKRFEKFAKPLITKDDDFFVEESKLFCSFFEKVDGSNFNLRLSDLSTKIEKNRVWNANMLRALKCMKVKDSGLIREIEKIATGQIKRADHMRKLAKETLFAIDPIKYAPPAKK